MVCAQGRRVGKGLLHAAVPTGLQPQDVEGPHPGCLASVAAFTRVFILIQKWCLHKGVHPDPEVMSTRSLLCSDRNNISSVTQHMALKPPSGHKGGAARKPEAWAP